MTWNYRICKETFGRDSEQEEVTTYDIRECYYNDANEICAVSDSTGICSAILIDDEHETTALKELNETLIHYSRAFTKPVVNLNTLRFADFDD